MTKGLSHILSTRRKVHLNHETPPGAYTSRDLVNQGEGLQTGRGELWSVFSSVFFEFLPQVGNDPAHRDSFFHSSSNLARRVTSSRFVTTCSNPACSARCFRSA